MNRLQSKADYPLDAQGIDSPEAPCARVASLILLRHCQEQAPGGKPAQGNAASFRSDAMRAFVQPR